MNRMSGDCRTACLRATLGRVVAKCRQLRGWRRNGDASWWARSEPEWQGGLGCLVVDPMARNAGGLQVLAAGFLLLAAVAPARGQTQSSGFPHRVANYTIRARLDPAAKVLSGVERIDWRNAGDQAAPELCFHLYWNAFANSRTTFMREYAVQRPGELGGWDGWGGIEITSVRVNGSDRTAATRPAHPDDPNPSDRTVVRVPLAEPIPPGGAADVEIEFEARIPRLLLRAGYAGRFFFVAQWYPKLGVYRNGEWNCHQYHALAEFFSDFGTYDVTLTVPHRYAVGATGVLRESRENGDGTRTLRYVAEDVHDFAWVADPEFREIRREIDGVPVVLLCRPRDCRHAERHLEAVGHALAWFRKHVAPYPYPMLTLVDPGWVGARAASMEYPMLVSLRPARWIPRAVRLPESTAVHEVSHQYWYAVVASNEFEEAWLDEGLSSYSEEKVMEAAYGARSNLVDFFGLQADVVALHRSLFLLFGTGEPIAQPAWEFRDWWSYIGATYAKTALALRTLERYAGEEAVLAGLRLFYARWQWRHPTGGDFFRAMSDAAGRDLEWFFEPIFRHGAGVDYAVTRVETSPLEPLRGAGAGAAAPEPPAYRSRVVIERLGEARLPVDIAVSFAEGPEMREAWDGQARWRQFEYTGTQRVHYAAVDPRGAILLDADPVNNSRMRVSGTRGLVRLGFAWGFWFQNLLHLLAAF